MKTPRSRLAERYARTIGVTVGLLALGAAAASLPETLRASPFAALSPRLMMKEPFREEALRDFADRADTFQADRWCSVAALQGAALLRAVSAERALSAGAADADAGLEALKRSASSLLGCSPTLGFAWFALYWVEVNRFGPTERALSYLEMSYSTAPREAWTALMRNEAATRVLALVSSQVRAEILEEWRDLLKAGLFDHASRVLARADVARRETLVAALTGLDPDTLKWFPSYLGRVGLELELPGIRDDPSAERDRARRFR